MDLLKQKFNENENLIRELENEILHLQISEVEDMIKSKSIDDSVSLEKICKSRDRLIRFRNRIVAVNQKYIDAEVVLKNRVVCINNIISTIDLSCNIMNMDFLLNSENYLVRQFYQEVLNKYNLIVEFPVDNNNICQRRLKIQQLNEEEKKEAFALDIYIKLCVIKEVFEQLIDCIKCIQFNYILDRV